MPHEYDIYTSFITSFGYLAIQMPNFFVWRRRRDAVRIVSHES